MTINTSYGHLRPLTPEEFARAEERLLNPKPGSKIAAARDYGVDSTLLIEQLRLTPAERAKKVEDACNALEGLRGIARKRFMMQFERAVRRLAAALAPFHPRLRGVPPGLPFLWDEQTLRNGTIFTLQTDIGAIDLLAEVAGVGDFASANMHSTEVEAYGRQIKTLTLSALIAAKRAAGRPKDLAALPEPESLLEAGEP